VLSAILIEKCGCQDIGAIVLPDYPLCLDLVQNLCNFVQFIIFYSNGLVEEKCSAHCPLECDSNSFQLTISNCDYPTLAYADQLVNYSSVLNRFFPNQSLSTITYDQLKRHILAANIYFSDMKYTSIEEVEKVSFIDFVAGIGGTLGLFLGISFLSFIEIVDILIETIYILAEKRSNKSNVIFIVKPEKLSQQKPKEK
jgi:hypothetical protein